MGTRIVGIDPGTKAVGWASVLDGKLVKCGLIRSNGTHTLIEEVNRRFTSVQGDLAVIELPQVYRDKFKAGRPNDLIDVAVISGAAYASLCGFACVELVRPRKWKGGVPKEIHGKRIMQRLTEAEQAIVKASAPKYLLHNVVDAVGLAQWGYELFTSQRVVLPKMA